MLDQANCQVTNYFAMPQHKQFHLQAPYVQLQFLISQLNKVTFSVIYTCSIDRFQLLEKSQIQLSTCSLEVLLFDISYSEGDSRA